MLKLSDDWYILSIDFDFLIFHKEICLLELALFPILHTILRITRQKTKQIMIYNNFSNDLVNHEIKSSLNKMKNSNM